MLANSPLGLNVHKFEPQSQRGAQEFHPLQWELQCLLSNLCHLSSAIIVDQRERNFFL